MASNADLDAVGTWLCGHPAAVGNREIRREKLSVLQAAADELTDTAYQQYASQWRGHDAASRAQAAALEREGALYFLRQRLDLVIAEVRAARVTAGLLAWHCYNMGYVFKSPQTCFGIDLHGRGLEALADDLDFLLITHSHGDHVTPALLEALQARGKPVVSNWWDGGRRIAEPAVLKFGPVEVRVGIGDHGVGDPARANDMLLYEVDTGAGTVYHVGDNANLDKMRPARSVDYYIFHVSVGLPVAASIRKVDARLALVSHVLELGHSRFPPHAWRWSFNYAYEQIKEIDPARAEVPAWGERFELP